MPTRSTPQGANTSGRNAHAPPFCRRVDSFDKEEPARPLWLLRRLLIELEEADYKTNENAKPEPPRRRKRSSRCVTPVIDGEAGVDGDASGDERTDHKNDDLDGFRKKQLIISFELCITFFSLLNILLSQFITFLTINHCI